jgi:hypothetical protein
VGRHFGGLVAWVIVIRTNRKTVDALSVLDQILMKHFGRQAFWHQDDPRVSDQFECGVPEKIFTTLFGILDPHTPAARLNGGVCNRFESSNDSML